MAESSSLSSSNEQTTETSTIVNSDTSSDSDTEEGPLETPVASMLDKLRSPPMSSMSRKRSVHCNQPPIGKKRSSGTRRSDPKSVPPSKRVSEFTGEQLTVSAGRLFCKACRETLSLKRSCISSHVKSSKHFEGKKDLPQRIVRRSTLQML